MQNNAQKVGRDSNTGLNQAHIWKALTQTTVPIDMTIFNVEGSLRYCQAWDWGAFEGYIISEVIEISFRQSCSVWVRPCPAMTTCSLGSSQYTQTPLQGISQNTDKPTPTPVSASPPRLQSSTTYAQHTLLA